MHSTIRRQYRDMDPTTQQFVNDVYDLMYGAADLGGQRAVAALRETATHIQTRDLGQISTVPAADVHLTDEQWERIAGDARMMASTSGEEW